MPNPVVRWQIISPEPEKAADFYQKLFAWKLSTANALGHRELSSGAGTGIDGGVWPAPQVKNGFVQLFIEVPDVDVCISEATRLGAKVLVPRAVLPDGDSMAVLLDPLGVSFGVCSLIKTGRARPASALTVFGHSSAGKGQETEGDQGRRRRPECPQIAAYGRTLAF